MARGDRGLSIRNDNGIAIELKNRAEGLAFSVGVTGITIERKRCRH